MIKGAGSIAIALPFLEIMSNDKLLAANGEFAKRFIAFYTPGGTVLKNWTPTGSETDFKLSPILSPLEAVKNKILVMSGLQMASAKGEQHQAGAVALLTGTSQQDAANQYATGPSVDQALASRLSKGKKFASLQMAVRWATGKSHGAVSPMNIINFEANSPFSPIPPAVDPKEIWQSMFGSLSTDGKMDAAAALALQRDKSILDFVDKKYNALSKRLGQADRMALEQHLTKIRELETSLSATGGGAMCKPPTLVDTSDYNPRAGLDSADDGSNVAGGTDKAIPKVGKFMMDMMVMAMACDLTGVGTMQWTDTEAKHTFPWLDTIPSQPLINHHHFYQHDGGYKPDELTRIYTWYASQFAYFIDALSKVNLGDHTLLDETVMFWGSELQEPPTHSKTNMPFLLAGNGGGLKTGRWLTRQDSSHNNLLVNILNLCGDDRKTFGKADYVTGALAGLT